MQFSGYSPLERRRVYEKAKKKYNPAVTDDRTGVKPMYRAKSWEQLQRHKDKNVKKKYGTQKEDTRR